MQTRDLLVLSTHRRGARDQEIASSISLQARAMWMRPEGTRGICRSRRSGTVFCPRTGRHGRRRPRTARRHPPPCTKRHMASPPVHLSAGPSSPAPTDSPRFGSRRCSGSTHLWPRRRSLSWRRPPHCCIHCGARAWRECTQTTASGAGAGWWVALAGCARRLT